MPATKCCSRAACTGAAPRALRCDACDEAKTTCCTRVCSARRRRRQMRMSDVCLASKARGPGAEPRGSASATVATRHACIGPSRLAAHAQAPAGCTTATRTTRPIGHVPSSPSSLRDELAECRGLVTRAAALSQPRSAERPGHRRREPRSRGQGQPTATAAADLAPSLGPHSPQAKRAAKPVPGVAARGPSIDDVRIQVVYCKRFIDHNSFSLE